MWTLENDVFQYNHTVMFFTDDLPELQEVQDDQLSQEVFQVTPDISHDEGPEQDWSMKSESSSSSNTNWLTELANIATSPQSPLLQNTPHPRSVDSFVYTVWITLNIHSF